MTPRELLDAARALTDAPPDALQGAWPRAVALLVRQALEQAVAADLAAREPDIAGAPFTVQLLCLRATADPADLPLVERLHATWSAASEACHFHGYELAPHPDALATWLSVVEEGLALLDQPVFED